jgi:hypothetical protein
MERILLISLLLLALSGQAFSQSVPTQEENIPYLVTFGGESDPKWGDDDFCQVFFFVIPASQVSPFYIRIYDPDCGGALDEPKGEFDTKTVFSVYGGKGCISVADAKSTEPTGNFKSGNLIATKTFGVNDKYDQQWYAMGPFNPTEGELMPEYGGYVFKVIAQGTTGDDGNLYRYFCSAKQDENKAVEGANAFTFEYTFRMHDNMNNVSHIYPYVDDKVISVKISNFDWDNDGIIRIISVSKNGEKSKLSAEGNWVSTVHPITDQEKKTSLDIQFIKNKSVAIKNNNVVVYVTNQYGELLPFFVQPIGGVPRYKPSIGWNPKKK